ncbi:Pup--protein ligase [Dermabacter hominis]|uniref:Pup--protein ligase n=1 Tax=Dermabacter hominis TaxID=36740 RepID=UPI0021A4ADAF|nr:Pup--protein ligase [Dermabacter hominis]MCT2055537.1 Pup--protein ligase [Dermabacter hominis]MCT2082981.1 Pup--protein ligase [Dermabacter hominis]MCT2091147.1 Pup--protein ligase [Dermabacter hominis]MCT2190008.1 Pup--protein ligase [Dermabacter hominis]MCT2227105.1 Pup--protein ligase [Dermabacter hominis]
MKRRVGGLETEFGLLAVTADGRQALEPEAAARELFRPVVAWGRSSNVFLTNAGRLYLDVGSHPEYATAECDDPWDIVAQERAGERELHALVHEANARLKSDGRDARIHLFKNNADSQGNSFGSHENYLVERKGEFTRLPALLLPFLITRQIVTGAGGVLEGEGGPVFGFSLRADHMWETVSSATTRARPIINTRDEPHGDPSRYRRLHVISGDSTMSEVSTWLRFAMTFAVLRFIEDGHAFADFELADPISDIRRIARDLTASEPLQLKNGGVSTALSIQRAYFSALERTYDDLDPRMMDTWDRGLRALETGNFSLVNRELDWAIKHELFTTVADRRGLALNAPEIQRLELAYHDIDPDRGVFYALERRGLATSVLSDERIEAARRVGPATTRAHLRSKVLTLAREKGIDVAVDWTTVRPNTPGALPITLLDPFEVENPEIDRLLDILDEYSSAPAELKGLQ